MPIFEFVSPKEVKEGKYIVKTPVIVETSAPINIIIQTLESRVTAAPDKSTLSFLNPLVYIASKSEKQIIYACGVKANSQIFLADVSLSRIGDKTTGIFRILRHFEQSGAVKSLDLMRALRNEVRAAFASVDASAKISE